MMKRERTGRAIWAVVLGLALGTFVHSPSARADGTETLGAPSIAVSGGTGFVVAGTGLREQPGTIDLTVPAGSTIQQVLLYWSGEYSESDDDTIVVAGNEITGTLIGGPTLFFNFQNTDFDVTAYRADITALGLVRPGANSLTVEGLDYIKPGESGNHGAGIVVILDDGGDAADIQALDGADIAFCPFPEPRQTLVAQTFSFAAADEDRMADLAMLVATVEGRPHIVEITVDGDTIAPVVTTLVDPIVSSDGLSWDTVVLPVKLPAGASSVTVRPASGLDDGSCPSAVVPASMVWVAAALAVPPVTPPDPTGECNLVLKKKARPKKLYIHPWHRYGWCKKGKLVQYRYKLKNEGDNVVRVKVWDDKLGFVGYARGIRSGKKRVFKRWACISETTTNVAKVRAQLRGSDQICEASASATVEVVHIRPVRDWDDDDDDDDGDDDKDEKDDKDDDD